MFVQHGDYVGVCEKEHPETGAAARVCVPVCVRVSRVRERARCGVLACCVSVHRGYSVTQAYSLEAFLVQLRDFILVCVQYPLLDLAAARDPLVRVRAEELSEAPLLVGGHVIRRERRIREGSRFDL